MTGGDAEWLRDNVQTSGGRWPDPTCVHCRGSGMRRTTDNEYTFRTCECVTWREKPQPPVYITAAEAREIAREEAVRLWDERAKVKMFTESVAAQTAEEDDEQLRGIIRGEALKVWFEHGPYATKPQPVVDKYAADDTPPGLSYLVDKQPIAAGGEALDCELIGGGGAGRVWEPNPMIDDIPISYVEKIAAAAKTHARVASLRPRIEKLLAEQMETDAMNSFETRLRWFARWQRDAEALLKELIQ